MNKRLGIIAGTIIAGLVIVSAVVAFGHNSNGMNMPPMSSNSSSAVATDKVAIQNYNFSPSSIKVKAGTTVTWTNQDDVHHTVTMDSGSSGGPDSSQLGKGESYSYTFSKAGTYNYHCGIHPEMHGTVIVT